MNRRFFASDAVNVARSLIGCVLVHGDTAGRIIETEAYDQTDAASHSHRGRTPRNRVMFGPGGYAYVYRSYGIHWCMNVACGPDGHGAAVLIRALEPLEGLDVMARRRGIPPGAPHRLCRGPGNLTQAMGIDGTHDGASLLDGPLRLEEGLKFGDSQIAAMPRVGITKAVEVPWRFAVVGHKGVSLPRPTPNLRV